MALHETYKEQSESIKLTKLQKEFLQHRLDLPDCISEVFQAEGKDFTAGEIQISVDYVGNLVNNGELKIDWLDSIDRAVLRDCIEGSTWFACNINAVNFGEMSEQKINAQYRSIEQLVDKLEQAGFDSIAIPALQTDEGKIMNIEFTKEQLELAIKCVTNERKNLKALLTFDAGEDYERRIRAKINKASLLLGSLEKQRGDV